MTLAFEVSGLRELTADLRAAPAKVAQDVRACVSKGALNIKNQLQEEMGRSRSFAALASSITYDLIEDDEGVGADIGPVKRSGGGGSKNLDFGANIAYAGAYFGGSRGGGTVPVPDGALDAEEPRFLAALEKIIDGGI